MFSRNPLLLSVSLRDLQGDFRTFWPYHLLSSVTNDADWVLYFFLVGDPVA